MEAFEPEPRRPEQVKRFSFVAASASGTSGKVDRTERIDKKKLEESK